MHGASASEVQGCDRGGYSDDLLPCVPFRPEHSRGAKELALLTMVSIERDSHKDQAVVFIFIIATAGLLLWAVIKPCAERWIRVCMSTILRTEDVKR